MTDSTVPREKELSDDEKNLCNDMDTEMKYHVYFDSLTPELQKAKLKNLKRMAAKKAEDGQAGKKQKLSTAVDFGSSSEVESEEDVGSDEDLEIPPKTTIQKPNSSLQMFSNSYMDKYSKHPKLTKQELKSPTLAADQSLFKAEKMTEPLKIPASAAAYYVMTHHSKLDNLTPAEINVLWGKVSDEHKKKCIEEHQKKYKDYVYEYEKFLRTLSRAEIISLHTIVKNRARDEENEVKKSSDEESESTSTNEDQTSCDDEA
ncbi:hypothetical protein DAPPUDRAFT_336117 [Daphnia pulex]|nr:hypothetical protein DAPPUDRAFT_336117 [Daphnia pulex]|eukprot:EFX62970.1 hypothetical protein DAPPUDRAFT_336117 [Daphnia pulex]